MGGGFDQGLLDGRMAVQAEEAVGPEIEHFVVADPHPPLIVHVVDAQILQMDVGHVVQEQQRQPHDPIAAQMGRQLLDGVAVR